jgi:hypothetical protein
MVNTLARTLWLALGAIGAIWLLTFVAQVVEGGDLDPPAAPGSTMQTLDDLIPSWHKSISGVDRFENFQAEGYVLDRETGLVWEQTPSMTTMTWESAADHCWDRTVAGELASSKGWRLPTVEELGTLIEPGASGTPKLPSGHPFSGISGLYWSATASTAGTFEKYYWDTATTSLDLSTNTYSVPMRAWCIRAPGGFDNVSDNLS